MGTIVWNAFAIIGLAFVAITASLGMWLIYTSWSEEMANRRAKKEPAMLDDEDDDYP